MCCGDGSYNVVEITRLYGTASKVLSQRLRVAFVISFMGVQGGLVLVCSVITLTNIHARIPRGAAFSGRSGGCNL